MFTIYYNPHPALKEYVETICIMGHEFEPDDFLSPIYTYMPAHTRFICFYLRDPIKGKNVAGTFDERARSMIIGPQITPVTLDLGKKILDVIVMLKPCGLYRLLGIPLWEIVDRDFDARLMLGKEIDEVVERLMNTSSHEKKNHVIQEYLLGKLAKLKPSLPIDRAMLYLVGTNGNLSMDILASKSCLGVRQLERQCLNRIGVPPKYFARIIRFSEAYKFKELHPQTSWIEIAYRFGYFDQMHLIRDFRHFTGVNPNTFNEERILKSVRFNSLET